MYLIYMLYFFINPHSVCNQNVCLLHALHVFLQPPPRLLNIYIYICIKYMLYFLKYHQVPKSTTRYPKVPSSTQKYHQVPKSIIRYPKVPPGTQKYHQVPKSITRYPEITARRTEGLTGRNGIYLSDFPLLALLRSSIYWQSVWLTVNI